MKGEGTTNSKILSIFNHEVLNSSTMESNYQVGIYTEGWNLTFRCLEKLLPIRILFTEFVICVLIETLTNSWNIAFSLVGCLFVRR